MNKIAFVTGASKGIGKAIALGLLAKGCKVAVGYYSSKNLADEICGWAVIEPQSRPILDGIPDSMASLLLLHGWNCKHLVAIW